MPTISQPTLGGTYAAGDVINYAGDATDTEDVTLPDSAFSWTIVFHHNQHVHPFLGPFTGARSGNFTIPTRGEVSTSVWYRVHLTVTDSGGQSTDVYRDVLPRTVQLTADSSPAGMSVTVDGQPHPAPFAFGSVVGMIRNLGAPPSGSLAFWKWSDDRAQIHNIATPDADTTYTATFRAVAMDAAQMQMPMPGAVFTASSATFGWTTGTGVSQYRLRVGSTFGGSDLYDQMQGTSLSAMVPGLPTDGRTLFVRLSSLKQGQWLFNDYRYTALTAVP